MKTYQKIIALLASASMLALCGCTTDKGGYKDEEEFSSMPWNVQQSWEAAPSIPGMSGPGGY